MTSSRPAVLLLSGGLDSGTLLTKLIADGVHVIPISFDYGQRHAAAEMAHAASLVKQFSLRDRWSIFNIPSIFSPKDPSTLLNPTAPMPHQTYEELSETEGPSPTYVPNRNAILISTAVAHALQNDADFVYIATHAEDARNWAYPDCTPEFNGAMASAVYIGTYFRVRLMTPFQWMMKRDIVRLGLSLSAPFDQMWSCYEGGQSPCGKCPTCVERAQAFQDNGVADPAVG